MKSQSNKFLTSKTVEKQLTEFHVFKKEVFEEYLLMPDSVQILFVKKKKHQHIFRGNKIELHIKIIVIMTKKLN